jgi:hypothetical protein
MITATLCLIALLVCVTVFLKINHTELHDITKSFTGIIEAGLQELRFRGGRAAKANIILSIVLAILFVLFAFHGIFNEIAMWIGIERDQQVSKYLYVVFVLIILFFLVSVCLVYASDRYRKMRA